MRSGISWLGSNESPHPITGDRRQSSFRATGNQNHDVAIDDTILLVSVQLLPDEQKATTAGFLIRAVGWFSEKGFTCSVARLGEPEGFMGAVWRPQARPTVRRGALAAIETNQCVHSKPATPPLPPSQRRAQIKAPVCSE